MPTHQQNRINHKAFFEKLAKLCAEHGASIGRGSEVLFMDGLVGWPETQEGFEPASPGCEAETTARYMIHQIGDDGAEVEALEYNFHVQGEA